MLEVPVELVQVTPVDRCIHSELQLNSVHVLLPRCMLTLPLVLVKYGQEPADLACRELYLDFFRAQKLNLNLSCLRDRLFLVVQTLDFSLIEHFHRVKCLFVVAFDSMILLRAQEFSVDV